MIGRLYVCRNNQISLYMRLCAHLCVFLSDFLNWFSWMWHFDLRLRRLTGYGVRFDCCCETDFAKPFALYCTDWCLIWNKGFASSTTFSVLLTNSILKWCQKGLYAYIYVYNIYFRIPPHVKTVCTCVRACIICLWNICSCQDANAHACTWVLTQACTSMHACMLTVCSIMCTA